MVISDRFWEAPLEGLKKGYLEEKEQFVCLLCGNEVEGHYLSTGQYSV